jgi:CBS domain containing-hemolysin-like protein
MVLLGTFFFAWFAADGPWNFGVLLQAVLAAWLVMIAVAYALPQLLYRRTSARWLMPLLPLLRVMAWVARPCVALLGFFQSLIDLGDDAAAHEEQPTSAENIEALISAGQEEGLIEEQDRELIQSVVEFGDKVVREVMTPRPRIVAIPADSTLEELRQLVINEQYSRIPAFEKNIDQITGFVHVRDMFELEEDERARRLVRELVRPIPFVPETKPVNGLMRQMQQENTHMVIVVDEYGNTAGLATMEDLLEVIIGEIRDEHEPGTDVMEDGHGGFIVAGNFDLDRVTDLFASFHREEDVESTTVGGLVGEWLGRVPKVGELVDRDGIRVEVLASDEWRVEQVRISKSEAVTHE